MRERIPFFSFLVLFLFTIGRQNSIGNFLFIRYEVQTVMIGRPSCFVLHASVWGNGVPGILQSNRFWISVVRLICLSWIEDSK